MQDQNRAPLLVQFVVRWAHMQERSEATAEQQFRAWQKLARRLRQVRKSSRWKRRDHLEAVRSSVRFVHDHMRTLHRQRRHKTAFQTTPIMVGPSSVQPSSINGDQK